MKFAEHLAAHITPEWRKQYISYEEMKCKLYTAVEEAPSPEVTEEHVIDKYYAKFDEDFFRFCDKELARINTFFSEKMAEATRKYNTLKQDLQVSKEEYGDGVKKKGFFPRFNNNARKMTDLKLAFSEFYLSLILLQNYQNLNFTGFRKILKKHDKLLSQDNGAKWRESHVDCSPFNLNKDIDKIIQECENTFTSELEQGDRAKAMKRLRVPPLGEAQSPWTTFKVGLFSGALIVLLVTILITAVFPSDISTSPTMVAATLPAVPVDDINLVVTLRLFRAPLLLFFFLFCIGFNIYGWRSSGVNHVLIFEIDPRNHLSEQHLIEMAAIFGVIWSICLLGFLYAPYIGIPPSVIPIVLIFTMFLFLFNPLRLFHHEARFWLLKKFGRVLCAPFVFVQFADFWLADQFNTLASVFVDFEHIICFYWNNVSWEAPADGGLYAFSIMGNRTSCAHDRWTSSIVRCLPAWWRFAQCLRRYRDTREGNPHLLNAIKYSTTFFVVAFGVLYEPNQYANRFHNPWFYMLVISRVFSSCYVLWWDLIMDWGLFEKGDNLEFKFLREEMVYSSPYYYYFAIVQDAILRFSWVLPFAIKEVHVQNPAAVSTSTEIIVTILAILEVQRRFTWNFFRLENEHLNNCGKFRAVRDISIIPLDASDQAQIVKMMDEDDGVTNRRKRKVPKGPQPVPKDDETVSLVSHMVLNHKEK